ncbi:unnamed protein product [Protopolystoma xenopodis]|uniref:Ig-like domain-containing protein n=1 Tax=Protopolystoma xenopodis TaxID=117903 RepID=A0A3S5AJQ5_9PLAT|nr:unnamed protein product [Protopolystoma xenopodis]
MLSDAFICLRRSGQLEVHSVPQFAEELRPTTVLVGEPVHLHCRLEPLARLDTPTETADKPSTELEVIWYHNGIRIPTSGARDAYVNLERRGDELALRIARATEEDEGTYRCEVRTLGGRAEVSCQLIVEGRSCLLPICRSTA